MTADSFPRATEDDAEELRSFIRDYVLKCGADGVVIGLSGGIDSAVVTKLAVDALGADKVHNMYLPSDLSPRSDLQCTEELSRLWNTDLEVINIQPALDAFRDLLCADMTPMDLGNASARCRMAMLYSRAKELNCIVVGTSNQSELMMGYFTKHGDGACDILPLANMYKTNVKQLARLLSVPAEIISKPPSAGFWEGQTDEDEMGVSYAVLDQVLYGLEQEDSVRAIAENTGLNVEKIRSIRDRVSSMAHKRRMAARPGNPL